MARLLTCSLVSVLVLGACGSDPGPSDGGPADGGPADGGSLPEDASPDDAATDAPMRMRTTSAGATGATCPDGSSVTYDSFAMGFFASYCVRCHSSTLTTSSERMGAPPDVNLDSHAAITPAIAARIDRVAAAGPTRINIFMPLSPPAPSDEERDRLGEWIACGTP